LAAATDSERPPRGRLGDSLRWRIALSYAGLLVFAGALLLFFVNAAARLATIPVETISIPDPVNGFVYTREFVDTQLAQARSETLERLRFYSILAFCVLAAVGLVVGWVVSGRALKPIGQIAAVARRISDRNLKERIALPGPEDELKQLADSFDAMVDRLDSAFERQRQFVADASHELRTPLTTLQLAVDSVRADPDATVDDYKQLAADVATATSRMRRLADDLLALAETDQPPAMSNVMLGPLAEAIIDELEPLAQNRQVAVASAVPPGVVVYADPLALRRAVRNLVENAIRYNHEGGHVMIEQAAAPPGHVALAVRDDGIGIPDDQLPQIFDRFHRVDRGRSRAEGGSGLGLAIVAKIAAELGGSVSVESQVGLGSRFILLLRAGV